VLVVEHRVIGDRLCSSHPRTRSSGELHAFGLLIRFGGYAVPMSTRPHGDGGTDPDADPEMLDDPRDQQRDQAEGADDPAETGTDR
jgi:hypothetical protein